MVMRICYLLICLAFLVETSFAAFVAVLETGADDDAKKIVSWSDRRYLTNVLREQAIKELPTYQNWIIMTRENISQMLPPDKSIEDCEGDCLVETGKNISADYICQARVGIFGKSLTLSAELYETAGSKLIASFNGRGENVDALLEIIKQKSPVFFNSIKVSKNDFSVSGIIDVGDSSGYGYANRKKLALKIISSPVGAIPTIDGKVQPKCLKTPCWAMVEKGNHRIVVSNENYRDDEKVVNVVSDSQEVKFELSSNFGWLVIDDIIPKFQEEGDLRVKVDGSYKLVKNGKIPLESGVHDVQLSHPCYDPVNLKVVIKKDETETYREKMKVSFGKMILYAMYGGNSQIVPVYIDDANAGMTPLVTDVAVCSKIEFRGTGWKETVNAKPKREGVVKVNHKLEHVPIVRNDEFEEYDESGNNVYLRENSGNYMSDISDSRKADREVRRTLAKKLRYHAHRGFYVSCNFNFGYTYYSRPIYNWSSSSKENVFKGSMIGFGEFRMGGSIANTATIYGLFGYGSGSGVYKYEDVSQSNYDYSRYNFGTGVEFYPVEDKNSAIYGFFVGASVGFMHLNSIRKDLFSYFRLDLGKDWWISERWALGVGVNYATNFNDDDGVSFHAVGLAIRFGR